jgi:signal transduction histidine kinase
VNRYRRGVSTVGRRLKGWRASALLFDAGLAVVLLLLEMITLSVGPHRLHATDWLYNAAGLVPVVIRRRWTWIAILLASIHAALPFIGIPLRSATVAVLVATYTAAVRLPIRQAVAALWLLWAPAIVLSAAVGPPYRGNSALSTVYYIAFSALSALVSFLIGRTVATRRAYVAALEDRARTAETSQQTLTDQAVAEERRRIARELHDVVAHHVSVMGVLATGSRRMLARDPAAADEALATIEQTGRTALREMRRLLTVLRADAEPAGELAPQPGLAGVEGLVEQMCEAGLPASLKVEGVPGPLDPGVALTVYRIVQEALTNALKHAGAAAVEVRLLFAPHELIVEICDTGRGPQLGSGAVGHGLLGMRERVMLYGGTLRTGPRPGGGYRVYAKIPVDSTERQLAS